jgi:hypothetical protein
MGHRPQKEWHGTVVPRHCGSPKFMGMDLRDKERGKFRRSYFKKKKPPDSGGFSKLKLSVSFTGLITCLFYSLFR